jgi:hypothetical protein
MSTEPIHDIELEATESAPRGLARRSALTAAAGGVAAAAAALFAGTRGGARPTLAAGSGQVPGAAPTPAVGPAPAVAPAPARQQAPSDADLAIANVAAGLEILAVNTYGAALDAAGSGALGAVPPAVAEFVTTAKGHHQAALDAWNGVLTSAGKPAVGAPPTELEASINSQFSQVTSAGGAAQLALMLEQVAADTYLDAISKLSAPAAINLAGSIYPIDRQHIAVLLFALGMYPVPETFGTVAKAYSGSGGMAAAMVPATK